MVTPRPLSIVRFERLYLAGFALSLVGWVMAWPLLEARLAQDPRTAAMPSVWWMLPIALALSAGVTLLLWWFVVRRASVVAKWIVTVLAGLSLVRLLFNLPLLLGGALGASEAVLSIATALVGAIAAAFLFPADARAWFAENGDEPYDDDLEEDA